MIPSALRVKEKLFKISELPTIPASHNQILKLIESANYSVDEVGKLIEMDQVLSSKVLKLVNSPFYGLYSNVGSVKRAVVLLGSNLIKGLVLSTSLFDSADKSLPGLWDHSYCSSTISAFLARRFGLITVEEIMTGALLHDIGKILIRRQLPEEATAIDKAVLSRGITACDAEKMLLDVVHDEAGAWLAEKWNLPRLIKDLIAYHHKPTLCSSHSKEAAIVHLADIIVKGLGVSYSGDPFVPMFDEKGYGKLGLQDDDLTEILAEIVDMVSADKMFSKYLQ